MEQDQSDSRHRRHCMIVHNYYPLKETRVEREARALIDHGYEVDVICLQSEGEPSVETRDGVNVYRLSVRRQKNRGPGLQLLEYLAFFVLAFAKVTALHRRRRYRVVQLHNLPDFLVFAALVPKLTGARLILDIHDLMPEFYAARFNSDLTSWPVRLVHWQERISCRFADHVITVTELWRETLIKRGLPPAKVSVVMNVADDRIFHQARGVDPPVRDDDCFRLIYHGTLTQRYGIDLAIRAVHRVRQEIPVHMTIHGRGTYLEALVKLTDELDLRERVHFSTEPVPTCELPLLIMKADLGVVPYRRDVFTDGILPTKLMEYVALGIPVIAARTPAIAAYFDETMVQFFTPGDPEDLARCILTLYADRKRLAQLAQGAGEFNRRYNWAKVGAEYAALVERLGGLQ
jgi:glycosyltransferase involved in cell wall biosynthesis